MEISIVFVGNRVKHKIANILHTTAERPMWNATSIVGEIDKYSFDDPFYMYIDSKTLKTQEPAKFIDFCKRHQCFVFVIGRKKDGSRAMTDLLTQEGVPAVYANAVKHQNEIKTIIDDILNFDKTV